LRPSILPRVILLDVLEDTTMMRRPIGLLVALGFFCAPLAAEAQPSAKVPRIGLLSVLSPALGESKAESFRQGLRELGYIEGQNFLLESRWAEGHRERLADFAADLVRLQVAVIVTESTPSALAAKQATDTIPIVMTTGGDPVAAGLVASLARPGGTVTGLTMFTPELSGTRLRLLKEAFPQTLLVAVLWKAENPGLAGPLEETQAAAHALGLQLHSIEVRTPSDLDLAFEAMARTRPSALITLADGMLVDNRARIVAFAAKSRLPAIFPDRDFAEAGGLMTYGPNLSANFRRAAAFVDKILKGAKPADLPVERPMTFELVINLKTAKALGLTIPPTLLFQADEVIQ
jgi:putative tryptophan/tyrosine transport system substrate-binding protein